MTYYTGSKQSVCNRLVRPWQPVCFFAWLGNRGSGRLNGEQNWFDVDWKSTMWKFETRLRKQASCGVIRAYATFLRLTSNRWHGFATIFVML